MPTASSSGPKRARQPARERQRYNPLRAGKKSDSDGWNQALVRFRAHFDTLYDTHNENPSGGLVPEVALAKINSFVKEDLKRSVSIFFTALSFVIFTNSSTWQQPLRDTKAGEGKRSRDVGTYLEGLLHAICQEDPALPVGGGSVERSTTVDALSRRECSFATFTRGVTG